MCLYLRRAVLVVPYPLFDQPHERRDVVELGFLEDSWRQRFGLNIDLNSNKVH